MHRRMIDELEQVSSISVQHNYKASSLTIRLLGEIPDPGDERIVSIVEQLELPGVEEINVLINSPGGNFDTAVMLYGMLKQTSAVQMVKTYTAGVQFSAQMLIFMAGQERVAQPYTNFMIHSTRVGIQYDSSPNTLSYMERHVQTVNRLMFDLFSEYFSKSELDNILNGGKDYYFDEIEAYERGIVNHVGFIAPSDYAILPVLGPFAQKTGGWKNG